MRNKGWIFTRHGTTVIGLNIVNANANTKSGLFAANDNIVFANINTPMVEATAAAAA